MEPTGHNEDLKKVMKEAGNYLELLEVDLGDSDPTGISSQSEINQDSNKNSNPRSKTVSKEMLLRLATIDKLASQGYQMKKTWDAIPNLVSPSGAAKSVLVSSQAGFSWIAFFFPFAVCTQIKEWSYFYVAGSMYLAGSIFYKASGWDPTAIVGLIIAYQYAYYFPYLRWLAIENSKSEIDKVSSVILGLALSFASAIPSIVFEAIFIDG